ncbi:MAG TPA: sigma 54-interacting transcriptional regulator [Firmicutes bacterium]|nr:sigma 54-interacting transcriptional regulator [Bacillota bacterium]
MAVVFLAPDAEMAAVAREVLQQFAGRVCVVEGLLSQALPVARRLEAEGAEVIVTRGGTALLLKAAGIKTPIVELPVTGQDMARALAQARELAGRARPRIGVVAFPNMLLDLEAFAPLLDLDICCFTLQREEDTAAAIAQAAAAGADVLLGGVITTRLARQKGIPAVLLRSGQAAFLQAFREAGRVAYARHLEKERTEQFKAILDYAHEGIAAVNGEGRLTVFNPAAERLSGVSAGEALGQKAAAVLPSARLAAVLVSGQEQVNELLDLGQAKVLLNCVPIRVGGRVTGALATFQDVTHIQQMEAKVRREIYSKGHVAKFSFRDIKGESPALKQAIRTAQDFARTESVVLITGETGVGKELFAQSIHRASRRQSGPFVAVNCAALPENLLESELFGYVEGAFTGANRKGKPGLFELAHGGTIFLDEISEIPLRLQGRLLRVLQEREVMRLGHDRVIPVDVRVLCATNKNLRGLVDEGLFRADLYWRLNVLRLNIPPLRERCADIPVLLDHFFTRRLPPGRGPVAFTPEALKLLTDYAWPGNVRELENFCERLAALTPEPPVRAAVVARLLDLAGSHAGTSPARTPAPGELPPSLAEALARAGGNKTEAARLLGIHRTTLWRRLKKARRSSPGPS